MNLQDLLRTHEHSPQASSVPTESPDPLAEYEVLVTLRLSAAASFGQRQVLGAVGISGHPPLFIRNAIGTANISSSIQTLYEQLLPPVPKPMTAAKANEAAPVAGEEIASAPAAPSALDIF